MLECGSGATTLLIAAELQRRGRGTLISLEHDSKFAARVLERVSSAGLDEQVRLVIAPLKRQMVGERWLNWYDIEVVKRALDLHIDLLIVDGPPWVEKWARWPAVPSLVPFLAPNAVVVLDDGRTRAALGTATSWKQQFPDYELFWIDTVKGTWLLRRTGKGRRRAADLAFRLLRAISPWPSGFGRRPISR